LLLIVAISQHSIEANVYSNGLKRPELKPCAILKSFQSVHKALSCQTDVNIGEINVLTSFDIERLRQINATNRNQSTDAECLHVLITKYYSLCPESIALESTTQKITYEDLGKQSAAIGQVLMKEGVKSGDTVGLCMGRSVSTIIIMMGILRAGAAYAPMDPSSPLERISQIIQRADIQILVTEEKLLDKFKDINAMIITPKHFENAKCPKDWQKDTKVETSQPVYFMFTSGSTGTPKGVIHGHGAVSLSLLECIEALKIDSSTRFMQSASLAFDASILEVFAPLASGGCICMVSQEERSGNLESTMQTLQVSHAWLTPSMLPQIQPENLSNLRFLGLGGEPASTEIVSTWGERVQLNNMYGTTEAGVWDMVKIGMKPGDNPKNIGRGIGNVACWITDPSNVHRLMPLGAEGELLIQSPYLALGYLKDPDRQAQALLDPSSLEWAPFMPDIEGSRVYRTGDLVKFNEHGEVIYLGRQTGYVKIRGLRVDLGEVETAINSSLKNGRSAVVLSEQETIDSEIVAFIETSDDQKSQLAEMISDHLRKLLPEYMIPSIFVQIDSLPLNVSKKIDRQKLRNKLLNMSQKEIRECRIGGWSTEEFAQIPETNRMAIEISNIIADMIKNKDEEFAAHIRSRDFSLVRTGLTSMQLVTLVNVIRRRYQKKLSIETLHKDVTICDIADSLTGKIELKRKNSNSRNLIADLVKLKPKLDFIQTRLATVFLTSITGFLGSQILRSLLEHPEIGHVIGLVRAKDGRDARRKVQEHGELGRWWKPDYQDRIEIWTGDLSIPKLGLEESKWDRLFTSDTTERVDCIIHNGARVNWMDSYEELEQVNIHSTVEILSGLSKMNTPSRLIYVSGGYMPTETESHTQIAKKLAEASGYDQTKFMSQLLLAEYNRHLDRENIKSQKAQTVIPGFIVGSQKEGIAHSEDFLWRLAFIITRLKAVSEDLQYLTVAGVDQVSNLIIDVFLQPERYTSEAIRCVDGVMVSTFCDVLSEVMGLPIERMAHEKWMKLLQADVEEADFDHPFMPMLRWFEENTWQFMIEQDDIPKNCHFDVEETILALESSVKYLMDIGYLSQDGDRSKQLPRPPIFSRSSF
jgi:amino acid adenylation domain-containing protein/thioester reductase-like protein